MNSFFKSFVNPNTTLKEFVEQFDQAMGHKIELENEESFASFHWSLAIATVFVVEKEDSVGLHFNEVGSQQLSYVGRFEEGMRSVYDFIWFQRNQCQFEEVEVDFELLKRKIGQCCCMWTEAWTNNATMCQSQNTQQRRREIEIDEAYCSDLSSVISIAYSSDHALGQMGF
ncbi:hypothetical protein Ancab_024850 [Ancistrocladus abbreviatus]